MNEVRRAAAEAGLPMPALSFVRTRDREWLQIGSGDAIALYDGIDILKPTYTGRRSPIADLRDIYASHLAADDVGEMPRAITEQDSPENEAAILAHPDRSADSSGLSPDHPEGQPQDSGLSEPIDPEDEDADFAPS